MYALIPLPFIIFTTIRVMQTKYAEEFAKAAVYQPLTTCLLILMALLSLTNKNVKKRFTFWITAGLVFSLGGDVSIIDPSDQSRLMIGLVFFLIAHLVYAAGFTRLSGWKKQDIWTGIVFAGIFAAFMAYVWPGLGGMTVPVFLYALAITFMSHRAVSTLFGTYFTRLESVLITLGALTFFVADAQLAVSLFRAPVSLKYGPFLYFGGQLLLALSPSVSALRIGKKAQV